MSSIHHESAIYLASGNQIGFLAGMLKRFAMFGLIVLWVAMSAIQASAAISAGGSHHRHTGMATAPMPEASGHTHHQAMAGGQGHHDASVADAESSRPCHTPDGTPASGDLSCCAAMCQAADVVPVIFSLTGEMHGTSYSLALMQRALPFATAGLERPPR